MSAPETAGGSPVQRLVVLGGGPEAWIAALALNRAFRHRNLEVTVVDIGPDPNAPLGYWTLPSQRGIHDMIGLRESDLLKRTGASFKFGTEHRGWNGGDSRFLHAHAEIGNEIEGMPFYKYLQMAAMSGRAEKPADFSVSAIAAGLGRFARPMEGSPLTSNFTYAFHIESAPYVTLLRDLAQAQGVKRVEGSLGQVSCAEDGHVDALVLASGERVEGDLFLDCSGAKALLMSAVEGGEREDWSKWLPCDRQWTSIARAQKDPAPVTRTVASDAGWMHWSPLAQYSLVGHVFCSAYLSDDEAMAQLRKLAPLEGEPRLIRFSSGKRLRPWVLNCVALGEAALELEPLAGAQLHAAQIGIGTLIELFPLDTRSQIESAEYARIVGEHFDALRDFTLAHYLVNTARTGKFRDAVRAEPAPARLANKLDLYRANGRIVMLDHESFEEVDWAWLLLGSGCLPATLEAQIQRLMEKVTPASVVPLHRQLVELANTMPPHSQYLRHG